MVRDSVTSGIENHFQENKITSKKEKNPYGQKFPHKKLHGNMYFIILRFTAEQ